MRLPDPAWSWEDTTTIPTHHQKYTLLKDVKMPYIIYMY